MLDCRFARCHFLPLSMVLTLLIALAASVAGLVPVHATSASESARGQEKQSDVAEATADERDADEQAAGTAAGVRFLTDRTIVRQGRVASVPMQVIDVLEADRVLEAASSDEGVVRVVTQPRAVGGMDHAYVLVEPQAAGVARLAVGEAAIEVEVKASPVAADAAPAIVGPVEGSYVWGEIAVGVECKADQVDALRLALPDGTLIEADETLSRTTAPVARMVFVVDCDQLPTGATAFTAVVRDDAGEDLHSTARQVHVVRPEAGQLIAGEAEDEIDNPRPAVFSQATPSVGSQPSASGGQFVQNYGREPEWCLVRELEHTGWYQLILRVSGDEAAAALPSVGVSVGDTPEPVTGARLVSPDWHRVAIGQPVFLEAGEQTLTTIFLNDFYVEGLTDRNLFIDRFELLCVARADGERLAAREQDDEAGATTDAPGMMMAGTPGAGGRMPTAGRPMSMAALMDASGGGSMIDSGAMAMPGEALRLAEGDQAADADRLRFRTLASITEEGALHPRLMVAFERPIDGQLLTGRVEIKGYTWWHEPRENPAPTITMLVNGEPYASQVAAEPIFLLDRAALKRGDNTVQLFATLPTGETAWTPIQRLFVDGEIDADRSPRRVTRFTALDPSWGETWGDRLTDDERAPGYKVGRFTRAGEATLTLPDELTGELDLQLHLRADAFEGQPEVRVTLKVEGEEPAVIEQTCWGWWNYRDLGPVTLPEGPKTLSVAFINEHHVEGEGERTLHLWAVQFVERDDDVDRSPPQVRLVHPVDGSEGYGADVAVVEAFDDTRLTHVDLLINGEPQRIELASGQGVGRFTLPILLRDLPAGEHTLSVRAEDEQRNVGMSDTITYTVLSEPPAELTRYERAVRLLNRFGYGPEPAELAAVLAMGERAYLEDRLARSFHTPGERAALGNAFARHREDHSYAITQRATQQILLTDNPVRMRFVLWAQNHFSTWIAKTQGPAKWQEHVRFNQLGVAPFSELLWASATSPAMLHYLDQAQSFRGQVNENYAREIMELHTLGVHAGYTQADVAALARLLTGLTLTNEARLDGRISLFDRSGYGFRFAAALHDPEPLTIFGLPLERAESSEQRHERVRQGLAMLASHPATARFVSRKLAEHYVSVPAPEQLVDDMTQAYLRTGGDMQELLLTIAEHPTFGERALPMKVNSPMDFAVRVVRVTGNVAADWAVRECAYRSGAGLFDRAMPDGYPEEDAQYATSNTLMQRWEFARRLEWDLLRLVPAPWHNPAHDDQAWRQQVIDAVAVRLTGDLLSETSNQAALDLLTSTDLTDHRRLLLIATFIAQLPEANMR